MAKTKNKKEDIVDLKPEKVTEEQLKKSSRYYKWESNRRTIKKSSRYYKWD